MIPEPPFGIYFAVSWIFTEQTTSGYRAVVSAYDSEEPGKLVRKL